MALVKYGGGVLDMSGSVGGNVFSHNRYGRYIRAKTIPTNPKTARQQAVRASVTLLAERWSETLTALQRTAWNLYGASVNMLNKLGETINLSGYNHYIRSNEQLARAGLTPIDAGPTTFTLPDADPLLSVTASEAMGQITVSFDDGLAWCSEDGAYMEIYGGQPQNAQRNFFGGPWRICGMFVGNSGAPLASPQILGFQYAIALGQHLWIYARIRRADGRLSNPFRAECFVAA